MSQVAVAEVAVVPVFKGVRRLVNQEFDGAAKTASSGFKQTFSKTGATTGKTLGTGFKSAFEQSTKGTSDKVVKALEADVAKASRALSAARLKEQDAIGKVRVAQAQLNEANGKYASDSSQVIRAQERLATASRQLGTAHETTEHATDDLKKAQGELARAADRAGDEMAESGRRGIAQFRDNVVGGVKSFAGPLITAFAALGIGRIVSNAFSEAKDFVADAINSASELEQSVGGVSAVFGNQAVLIGAWAATAADAVGLSRNAYNEFATVVGAQLKNLGIPIDEVAGETNGLIQLGADLAAQYGGPTSDAVSALSSLLRGERDPIERYGVSMNEAAVKAEAYRLGLVTVTQDADKVAAAQLRAQIAQEKYNDAVSKYGESSTQAMSAQATMISSNSALESALDGTTQELTNQQKAQATLSLLMQQTADAQGAFARESDTLAGKQQRNAAAWENIITQLGEGFLPVATKVADILGTDLLPTIAKLAEEHGPELAEAFADVLPELAQLAEDLLPQLPVLFEQAADSLPAVIGLLQWLAPILLDLAKNSTAFMVGASGLFSVLSGDKSILDLTNDIMGLEGPLAGMWQWAADAGAKVGTAFYLAREAVSTKIDEIVGFITGLPARAVVALGNLGNTLYSSGRALLDGFLKGIQSMVKPIGDAISGVLDWVGGFFPHSPAKRGPLSGSGWTRLEKSGEAFWDQWLGGMGGSGPSFPSFSVGAGSAIYPSASVAAASTPAVYVQNPFTGEYLLAQVSDVAATSAAGVQRSVNTPFRRGGRRP